MDAGAALPTNLHTPGKLRFLAVAPHVRNTQHTREGSRFALTKDTSLETGETICSRPAVKSTVKVPAPPVIITDDIKSPIVVGPLNSAELHTVSPGADPDPPDSVTGDDTICAATGFPGINTITGRPPGLTPSCSIRHLRSVS